MRAVALLVAVAAGAAVAWVGNDFGLWWLTLVAALAIGLLLGRALALLAGFSAGGLGWGLPLAWLALAPPGAPVERTAAALSGVLGVRGTWLPAVILTVAEGALLGLAGAWLGAAVRGLAGGQRTARGFI